MKHTEERQTCHIFLYCRLRCSSNVEALLASRSHFHILGWAVPKYLHKWFIFQRVLFSCKVVYKSFHGSPTVMPSWQKRDQSKPQVKTKEENSQQLDFQKFFDVVSQYYSQKIVDFQ